MCLHHFDRASYMRPPLYFYHALSTLKNPQKLEFLSHSVPHMCFESTYASITLVPPGHASFCLVLICYRYRPSYVLLSRLICAFIVVNFSTTSPYRCASYACSQIILTCACIAIKFPSLSSHHRASCPGYHCHILT